MSGAPSAEPTPAKRRSLFLWAVVLLYVTLLAAVVVSMFQLRRVTLETMGTPQARAEWEAWRQSAPNQRQDLPVQRRPPKSPEPPAYVLMRDHFPVILSAAVVFSSLLYAALAFAIRGAFGGNYRRQDSPQRAQRNTERKEERG